MHTHQTYTCTHIHAHTHAHTHAHMYHTHTQVLAVFINSTDFEAVCVPVTMTALEVLELHDISQRLDLSGIVNRGLFLKSSREEHMFDSNECPCEALFFINDAGAVVRIDEGLQSIMRGRGEGIRGEERGLGGVGGIRGAWVGRDRSLRNGEGESLMNGCLSAISFCALSVLPFALM